MPYLITTSFYPSDKVPEVAKMYLEAIRKFPPDEKLFTLVVPGAVKATHQGIQNIIIAEVKKGKLDEAYIYCASMMAMFQNIQGYEYRIDPYVTIEEAFRTVGMSPPA
jgi:hypothetical protein